MLTPNDIKQLTGNDGTWFRVKFIKRTTGKEREMTCRFGVKKYLKGGERAFDFDEKNVLGVWIPDQDRRPDNRDNGYRCVPCESILSLKAHGKTWTVVDGELVENEE